MSSSVQYNDGKESLLKRAMYALPLLLGTYGASQTMGVLVAQIGPSLINSVKTGQVTLGNGEIVPLVRKFFGIGGLDKILSILVTFFTPTLGSYDALGKLQTTAFLGDLVPLQALWYVESVRRGNYMTAAYLLPTVLGVAYQAKGLGYIAPIWFFLHYVQSPVGNYHAADQRLTQVNAVKAIIPTIVLSFLAPSVAMLNAPGLANRQWINGLFWQLFPLSGAICQRLLSLLIKDTTETDRLSNPEADMKHLRRVYWAAGIFAMATNLYVRITSPFPLKDVFFKDIASPSAPATLISGAARFLRYDQLMTFGPALVWAMMHFYDLKKSQKTKTGWATFVGALAGTTIVGGPGAAMIGFWAWREEALAATASRKKVVKKN
ncbi:hypothetical protein GLAREA_06320 [Glarea lozoyensis ATCC 20868]|uniref:Paxilline synthesis protein A n=1 Tax=Glarea lozoyensis (strain ATCC 20868 / MF5171) TaxID=1116229 RepID=S3E4J2_GLAL2|nr:uncharacterized protein GLAREA_06320 [Glarea lozoyensis ATCC 20868]EPE33308.1 hypothetical protein GLAREA_06320 [Glarea lozoyensis ATCC 20868]